VHLKKQRVKIRTAKRKQPERPIRRSPARARRRPERIPQLSIVIVSYNVREFLEQALVSIRKAAAGIEHEIWIVDNNSADGTAEWISSRFRDVRLIANRENAGFARANNQALRQCRGEFVCLINPDTIVQEDTFSWLLTFFASHPRTGVAGCKILNPDGTLQLACRRSFPTPWVAFSKISGLARIFPHSRVFGRYNLTYLDDGEVAEVEAISGSFMMVRRPVLDQVGLLDESFFMYGEDLDWCYRIRAAGWGIHYVPTTQIIHFKGESSKKSPFEQRRLFYEAMRLFVHKHFSKGQAWIPSWSLIIAIRIRALLSLVSSLVRTLAWPALDLLLMTVSLSAAIYIRFRPLFPWSAFIVVHAIYGLIWMASLIALDVYHRWRFSAAKAGTAVLLGWTVNSALTFFFKEIGFSRLVVLYAGALNLLLLPGWRVLLKSAARINWRLFHSNLGQLVLNRRALLVGDRDSCERILERLRRRLDASYQVKGLVWTEASPAAETSAIPVYTGLDHIGEIVTREKIQEVVFATDRIPYSQMLSVIAHSPDPRVSFKLVPSSMDVMIGKASIEYIDDIPIMEIDYRLQYRTFRLLKRIFDLILAAAISLLTAPVMFWHAVLRRRPRRPQEYLSRQGEPFHVRLFEIGEGPGRWWHHLPKITAIWMGRMSFVGRMAGRNGNLSPMSLSLKPGLTGLEYLHDQGQLDENDRERYHLYYLKNFSLFLDMEILIKSWFKFTGRKEKS